MKITRRGFLGGFALAPIAAVGLAVDPPKAKEIKLYRGGITWVRDSFAANIRPRAQLWIWVKEPG